MSELVDEYEADAYDNCSVAGHDDDDDNDNNNAIYNTDVDIDYVNVQNYANGLSQSILGG